MITPKDLLKFYKNSVTEDLMYLEDGSDTDTDLIQSIIDDSYNELEVLKDMLPSVTIDLYSKVLSLVSFLDRLGIDESAFEGLNKRANLIREMILENMTNSNDKIATKRGSIVRNDDNKIITDDFIDRFNS